MKEEMKKGSEWTKIGKQGRSRREQEMKEKEEERRRKWKRVISFLWKWCAEYILHCQAV
jgi:hypothetical protein